jgi:pimeloyl-ACP methyl ester carboxylesterase
MDILLVPGFMLDADLWTDIRPGLARHGRLVDVDTTRDTSIEAMARRAVGGLDRPAIVIDFSMGGYVTRAVSRAAPVAVVGLVLIATSSRGDTPARSAQEAGVAGRAAPFRALGRAAVAGSLHPDHRDNARIRRIKAMSERLGAQVYAHQSAIRRDDDTERLKDIRCPTLIVSGRRGSAPITGGKRGPSSTHPGLVSRDDRSYRAYDPHRATGSLAPHP